jgi:hypothetical protein
LTLGTVRFMFPNVLSEPPSTFKAGDVSSYEENKVDDKFKEIGAWVIRHKDERGRDIIYALSTTCTHLGCTPNWLESEKKFRDRVRGENMLPWGVAAARRLGVYETLVSAGAHEPQWWNTYMMGHQTQHRDLKTTTPGGDVTLNLYHPTLQEALLENTLAAGAEVRRGARVVGLDPANGQDSARTGGGTPERAWWSAPTAGSRTSARGAASR